LGTESESHEAGEIQQWVGASAVNLAGKTDLRQLFSLLQQCQLVISNDSGIMHAATAVQTPVLGIFGSTDPQATGPMGSQHRVIYRNEACSPCFQRTCPLTHYACLEKILVSDVLQQVEEMLAGN